MGRQEIKRDYLSTCTLNVCKDYTWEEKMKTRQEKGEEEEEEREREEEEYMCMYTREKQTSVTP